VSYSVRLLREAEDDFDAIYCYLFRRSPSGAANWAAAFEAGLDRLRQYPETCGPG